jgi:ferric-dicitrate binding protein FerR (iron transport regulator)
VADLGSPASPAAGGRWRRARPEHRRPHPRARRCLQPVPHRPAAGPALVTAQGR